MHTTVRAAIFAIAALAVTPAIARDAATPSVAPGQASSAKICLNATVTGDSVVTGSMLNRRACRTRAEWEAKGVKFQRREPAKD